MKRIAQVTLGDIARRVPFILVAILAMLGYLLMAGEEAPAQPPMPFGEWLALKLAGFALFGASCLAGRWLWQHGYGLD